MDPIIGLFAMEAFGVVDAEAMVKGVLPFAVCFLQVFFVGA
jgi:hypothetical protein